MDENENTGTRVSSDGKVKRELLKNDFQQLSRVVAPFDTSEIRLYATEKSALAASQTRLQAHRSNACSRIK